MDDHMSDQVELLQARVAEDEQAARAAMIDGRSGRGRWSVGDSEPFNEIVRDGTGDRVADDAYPKHAAHIARHDPARVLQAINAKRQILDARDKALREYQDAYQAERGKLPDPPPGLIYETKRTFAIYHTWERAVTLLASEYGLERDTWLPSPKCVRCGENLAVGYLTDGGRSEACPWCEPDHPFSPAVREVIAEQDHGERRP